MLMPAVNAYVELRRAAGFDLRNVARYLRDFATFATERGDVRVRSATAIAWAARGASVRQCARRLKHVIRFARHARAEDAAHEVPPVSIFPAPYVRRIPHIFTPDEVRQIVEAAVALEPETSLPGQTLATLFGLLVSCGLRISEALALVVGDVTTDGLLIRMTKFRKARLVPMHTTTEEAVAHYLRRRRQLVSEHDNLFVSTRGEPLTYRRASTTFLDILRKLGLRAPPGQPGPHLHDLRHTFAVRALERCSLTDDVSSHIVALSTYLGHVHVTDTYWYLQVTPQLMSGIADACSSYLHGGAP